MQNEMSGQLKVVKEQNRFLAKTYGWMAVALIVSGVVAFLTATNTTLLKLTVGNQFGYLVLAIAEIALVWWLSASISRISATAAMVAFICYAVLNGMTLASIFYIFAIDSIFVVFFISAAMFAFMAIYGTFTKSNISSFGRYFTMGLIGVIIASVINILIRSTTLDLMISIVTVVIFTGLTAYDAQKMLNLSNHYADTDLFKKASIIGALELYLDFINIFLAMLRLFGRRRN